MKNALYIAAKAPRVNVAKTRLGRAIGHDNAVDLYKAFLSDLALRFADAPFELGWYITPPDAWKDIAPLVDHGRLAPRVSIQSEGDWTERQRQLFRGRAARDEERVVLIASDSPHLTVGVVEEAFRQLDRHELVFGPTYDGGYYLIGMREFHDVLKGVPMSTSTVLDDITTRAGEAGLSIGWVDTTFDVDEVEDLGHLRRLAATRDDLAATRTALEALGLDRDVRRTSNGTQPIEPGPMTGRTPPEPREESR
ncbi:MAG: TIGR04282 family arsenosugar biosynthesis glycosyltransferase [Rubrobacter sp.]